MAFEFVKIYGGCECDPSKKLYNHSENKSILINDYFGRSSIDKYDIKNVDCVIIRHVLEHLDNFHEILDAAYTILSKDGILIVEVPNFKSIVDQKIFSNIFHEHLNYFTEKTLSGLMLTHDFSLSYSKNLDIHGGSLFCVFSKSNNSASDVVQNVLYQECIAFSLDAADYYSSLRKLVAQEIEKGHIVAGYGASHRTFVILGNSGISRDISYVVDQNKLMKSKKMRGFGIPIFQTSYINENTPDCIIIFAVAYEDEIIELLANEYNFKGKIITLRGTPDIKNIE